MITIGVNPVAFDIGTFEVRWYGIMVVLAAIAIIAISLIEARRRKISDDHVYSLAAWSIVSAIFFARAFHVVDHWSYYMANPGQIVGTEGVAVYGAVFGVVLAIVLYGIFSKSPDDITDKVSTKQSVWNKVNKIAIYCDMISPGALVGMAIGRVGCLLNGCCYGLPTTSFLSITYTNPASYAPTNVALLPTQIFHMVWNMIAFGVVWSLRKKLKPEGSLFLLYIALYSAGDLLIRTFRVGTPFLFGLQEAQLIGIVALVITIPLLAWRMVQHNKQGAVVSTVNLED